MTDRDLKTYETLLDSHIDVRWTKDDVRKLVNEVRRLRAEVEAAGERPTALRDLWSGLPRFVGGH